MKQTFYDWLLSLDRLLRGEATRLPALREGRVEVPLAGLAFLSVLLAMIHGLCMGVYALCRPDGPVWQQTVASIVKVPALFFLTLIVTFPSLYVFNALVGSRLTLRGLLALLVAAIAVNLCVLSSLGPVVAFFSVSTTSHDFMVVLNVLVAAVSGGLGLGFLLQTLHRLNLAERMGLLPPAASAAPPVAQATTPAADLPEETGYEYAELVEPGALDRIGDHLLSQRVKTVFACWMAMFGLVGAQMSWILRPFIGAPDKPFTWLRPRGSNFFQAVWHTLLNLL